MTALGPDGSALAARRAELGKAWMRAKAHTALLWLVAIWIFSGAFVFIEPSPYEVFFIAAFGLSMFAGLKLHKRTLPLLYIVLAFVPFALIAVFQVRFNPIDATLIYTLVTVFLMITSYFAANFVAQSPLAHMRLIGRAYIAAAVISAGVGILAYMGLLPGEDVFLRFGRAKAFFKDPNVYGPFLVLPAMILLQRVMLGDRRKMLVNGGLFLLLFVGVFVSFSRGAWGHFLASAGIVFLLCFFLEATARDKVRLLMLAIGGSMALFAALVALLSIEQVSSLFVERFALTQSYDSGETGRFGRLGYAFDLALLHPWGIGPLEFSHLRIVEQPHNTYVNVIHAYGWGGALAYFILVLWTLGAAISALARRSPNRLLMIPLFATFVPLIILSGIIDTDHWRHWFLVAGLIWGVAAGYGNVDSDRRALV